MSNMLTTPPDSDLSVTVSRLPAYSIHINGQNNEHYFTGHDIKRFSIIPRTRMDAQSLQLAVMNRKQWRIKIYGVTIYTTVNFLLVR